MPGQTEDEETMVVRDVSVPSIVATITAEHPPGNPITTAVAQIWDGRAGTGPQLIYSHAQPVPIAFYTDAAPDKCRAIAKSW